MSINVLIVDDSETVRAILAKTMRMAEIPINELHNAANGQEALDVLRNKWVDLVLTDINMPVMTGVELIEQMKKEDNLKGIPVVVVSTEGSATRVANLKMKGVRAYIRKPFTPEQFREICTEVLGPANEE